MPWPDGLLPEGEMFTSANDHRTSRFSHSVDEKASRSPRVYVDTIFEIVRKGIRYCAALQTILIAPSRKRSDNDGQSRTVSSRELQATRRRVANGTFLRVGTNTPRTDSSLNYELPPLSIPRDASPP